jgi:hypothetical protein
MPRLEMQGTDIPNAGPGGATKTLDALARPALLLDKDRLDRDLTPLVWPREASCCVPV